MPPTSEIPVFGVHAESAQGGPAPSAEGEGRLAAPDAGDALSREAVGEAWLAAIPSARGEGSYSTENEAADEGELSAFLALVQYDNRYRVDKVLKTSAFETTQLVTYIDEGDAELGPYVRKYLKAANGLGQAYRELYRVQQQGARFEHLPQIYALYQLKDELVVVMEYVQGETLQDVVYRPDPSPQLAIEVFPQICSAVRELHERFNPPIIHRDLKPANLILSWGKVTLIDFGIARSYRAGNESDTTHFGTRAYAPPEQYGFGQTDVRSDVYALGMLLFYCLTEREADAKDRQTGFADSAVPEEFRQVILRACAFDPDARYVSVAEMQQAFAEAASAFRRRTGAAAGVSGKGRPTAAGKQVREAGLSEGKGLNIVVRLLQRIPPALGMTWNVALALFWLLIVAVGVSGCFWPQPTMPEANYPVWFRAVEYLVFLIPSATCICYELSDRRLLRRKFPVLCRWPLYAEFLVVAVAVPFVLAVVMTFCAQVAGV